ncbi:MAG: hypothetical protein HQ559_05575 [Lentisphaerae bacterium]|nr:hypothetical protein [Lentisphaerota bacterium]
MKRVCWLSLVLVVSIVSTGVLLTTGCERVPDEIMEIIGQGQDQPEPPPPNPQDPQQENQDGQSQRDRDENQNTGQYPDISGDWEGEWEEDTWSEDHDPDTEYEGTIKLTLTQDEDEIEGDWEVTVKFSHVSDEPGGVSFGSSSTINGNVKGKIKNGDDVEMDLWERSGAVVFFELSGDVKSDGERIAGRWINRNHILSGPTGKWDVEKD